MYSLLRRRTMMMKPSVVPTERLIYQLNNYTCDGTINTFIDTGLKLFGYEYDAFRIEMEYDGLDLSTTGQETLLECKDFIIANQYGFTSGLSVRVNARGTYSPQYEALGVSFRPLRNDDAYFENTSSANLSIVYNKQNNSITVNGETVNFSGALLHNEPLTIGGRYSSHLSNPDRFVQVHISSLKIYAIANENYQYIFTPLTFKCLTGGNLSIKNANGSYDRNFEYSLNGGAWTAVDLPKNTASKFIATLSPNDTISFRRDNENFAEAQFLSDSNLTFDIYGNLLSLQYGSAFNGQTELRNTGKQAFGHIFQETNVVDASKLMLTATTLSNACYQAMFWKCTYLTHAPEIEARTFIGGQGQFQRMFSDCSSLIKAPSALYVSSLTINCYNEMFKGCTALTTAPSMSAVTNATGSDCCRAMFYNCTSLVEAPELTATSLGTDCYYEMFYGCTSLVTAPELPATTLANNCYKEMFYGCTSLTTAPELPATTLVDSCYHTMFANCYSLITAPQLPATTLAGACYQNMFDGCKSLINAPELPVTTLAIACYNSMFKNCTSLTTAPNLPATTLTTKCYRFMFQGCVNLVSAPNELPATILAEYCYAQMFERCTSLTTAPLKLPATTLADYCYASMFSNTNITSAPELPALQLVTSCYQNMFMSSKVTYVKCLATDVSASMCVYAWLASVPSNGTFVKNSAMNNWPSGNNGIPNNWTQAVEIEYLESSGIQYIDTGILPQDNEIIKVTFQFVGLQSNIIFGSRISSGGGKITIGSGSSGTQIYAALGNAYNPVISSFDQNEHTVILDTGTGYASIDNNTPVNVGVFSETNLQYYLFACNQNGSLQFLSTAKIKYLKIGNRMELIPVRVGSVGYMLDLVSKQLLGNNGTGDFTLGPDKTY